MAHLVFPLTALLQRIGTLAVLFALELTALTLWLDNAELNGRRGLAAAIREYGPVILRLIIGFAALFAAFALTKYRRALSHLSDATAGISVSLPLICAHLACLAAFGLLSARLYAAGQGTASSTLTGIGWLACGLFAIAFGALAFLRFRFWIRILTVTEHVWIYALAADAATVFVTGFSRSLWPVATRATFSIVHALLGLMGPVVSDPAHMTIGTRRFAVEIAPTCSGLEGVGLMLVFGLAWLAIYRSECRFPQALALLPAGMVFIFLLNSVRIAALILIGDAGAERIATGGFHSQAGWMIFNLAAIGFTVTAGRARWVTNVAAGKAPVNVAVEKAPVNVAAVWVLPLVALLTAGMIAHAATGDFEWLYPLRFLAVLSVVWHYKTNYAAFDWRIGWQAPAAGVIVFAVWMALDRSVTDDRMPAALAAAAPAARWAWIAVRALAASVTVPFAEELAFRGYLLPRVTTHVWVGVLVSSVAFGLMHGDRWFAGTLAGVAYALVFLRKGRIGEAVVAHGTTNALIAANVLGFQHWHLW